MTPPSFHKFRRIYCGNCGHHFDVPVPCSNRFCNVCNVRRRARVHSKLSKMLDALPTPPGYSWKHLTLSTSNPQNLRAGVKSLIHSFRKLRQTCLWKDFVNSGAFVIEITHSAAGYHPHIHAIILSKFFPWYKLQRQWRRCSSGTSVYIQRIPRKAVINYLTKYITKSSMPLPFQEDAADSLKGIRLVQFFGKAHNLVNIPSPEPYLCPECNSTCWLVNIDPIFLVEISQKQKPLVTIRSPEVKV